MEATAGLEPANKGFADLSLTPWVRRLVFRESGIGYLSHFRLFNFAYKLERETGFEPATTCLGSRCSTTELLPRRGGRCWI